MVTEVQLFESTDLTASDFLFLRGWTNSEAYKRKVNTQDELLTRILDAAKLIT
jgi:hypothetical protein